MSERCRCGRPSKGSVGMVRLCYTCAAGLLKQPKRGLRARFRFQLTHGRSVIGEAEWVPDAAISRERASALPSSDPEQA